MRRRPDAARPDRDRAPRRLRAVVARVHGRRPRPGRDARRAPGPRGAPRPAVRDAVGRRAATDLHRPGAHARPEILLLDEPTASLDLAAREMAPPRRGAPDPRAPIAGDRARLPPPRGDPGGLRACARDGGRPGGRGRTHRRGAPRRRPLERLRACRCAWSSATGAGPPGCADERPARGSGAARHANDMEAMHDAPMTTAPLTVQPGHAAPARRVSRPMAAAAGAVSAASRPGHLGADGRAAARRHVARRRRRPGRHRPPAARRQGLRGRAVRDQRQARPRGGRRPRVARVRGAPGPRRDPVLPARGARVRGVRRRRVRWRPWATRWPTPRSSSLQVAIAVGAGIQTLSLAVVQGGRHRRHAAEPPRSRTRRAARSCCGPAPSASARSSPVSAVARSSNGPGQRPPAWPSTIPPATDLAAALPAGTDLSPDRRRA